MSKNKNDEGVKVKRSRAGLGLFTQRNYAKNERIIEYIGEIISTEEANNRGGRYLFEINSRWTIDGSSRNNLARYINHSCRPNAEAIIRNKRIFIYAKKRIKEGEEICYNYGSEYFEEYIKPNKCRCLKCLSNN